MRKIAYGTAVMAVLWTLLGVGILTGAVHAGIIQTGNVPLDQPDNQIVEVDIEWTDTGYGHTATANLSRNGNTNLSETVDDTNLKETVRLNASTLDSGTYELSIDASREANTTVQGTRMIVNRTGDLNVRSNGTYTVEVGFGGREANATVKWIDESDKTVLESSALSFDPSTASSDPAVKTAEWNATQDHGLVDVRVIVDDAYAYESVSTSSNVTEGGGGVVGGGDENPFLWVSGVDRIMLIIGGLAVLLALAVVGRFGYGT
jgi:hypothetical protein